MIDGQRAWIVVWAHYDDTSQADTGYLQASVSFNNGQTWSPPHLVDSFYRIQDGVTIEANTAGECRVAFVWAGDDGIICIHPGWPMCRGREEVEDSWRRIFENTPYIEFRVTVIDCGVSGDRGWIVCEEAILQSHPNGMTRSVVLSTNMFHEEDGRWRLTLHHGSPVARHPVVEEGD